MKYRKKPVTVEAVQWWKDGDHPRVTLPPPFFTDKPGRGWCSIGRNHNVLVAPGDWIVTQDGRHSVVSAEDFAEYEAVDDERPKPAVTMTLTIGADTREAMQRALYHLAGEIGCSQIHGPTGCSGGCDYGYSYDFSASDRPTNNEYFDSVT